MQRLNPRHPHTIVGQALPTFFSSLRLPNSHCHNLYSLGLHQFIKTQFSFPELILSWFDLDVTPPPRRRKRTTAIMPTTRRSARQASGAGKQSTLSFNHRITKGGVAKSAKDAVKTSSLSKEYVPEPTEPGKPNVEKITITKQDREQEVEEGGETEANVEVVPEKSEAEQRAEKISDAAIERYWDQIHAARMAKAVHQKHTEGLTTGEKILRYFDVSSQYGVGHLFPLLSSA